MVFNYLCPCLTIFLRACTYPDLFKICSYEGRCGLPTNFDANYCYALGYGAGALLHSGKTGLISSVCASLFAFIFSLST
jgi:hypothetical protein